MKKKIMSQGDVNIIPVEMFDIKPEDFTHKLDRVDLAYGEITNHRHRIVEGDIELFTRNLVSSLEAAGNISIMLLRVNSQKALLKHEEHEAFEIPQGDYIVRIQQEADPFARLMRSVAD